MDDKQGALRRRAVNDEQKEVRRQVILTAAWQLFQERSYDSLTMIDIAHAAGLAKGTVFLYYKTKEALFLSIVEQELENWFTEIDQRLQLFSQSITRSAIKDIAALLCSTLLERPGLTRLLTILHTILEQNIDLTTAIQFKQVMLAHFQKTGGLLESCLPFLSPGQGAHVLLQSYALLIGFWQLADPAPIVKEALKQPELELFAVPFAREYARTLETLLVGLEYKHHQVD